MFRKIAAFEFRYHLRSPLFWVTALIIALLTFGSIASDSVRIGGIAGNVKKNSPFAVGVTLQTMSIFAVFIMAAFVSNVVVRDDETGFGQIVHSTRISRFDYLFGRFTGAFAAGCAAFVSVPLGMLLGSVMPWMDPDTLGPFRPGDYLYAYFAVALPTLVVMAAFCFALATMTRSMLGTYVGLVAMLMTYFVSVAFFSRPEFERIVALLDPFGSGAYGYATKYWTAAERNTRLPAIADVILWNRVIWLGLGFVFLTGAFLLYRPAQKGLRRFRRPRVDPAAQPGPAPERSRVLAEPRHDAAAARAQLLALARFDMKSVFRSPAFFVLLGIGFLNSAFGLWFANQDLYGNPFYPVTRIMIQTLNGAFTLIPLIVAIYYAGELVWRGREQRVQELVDATPAPEWAFVLPKVLAITLVLIATVAAGTVAAIAVQMFRGYTRFELGNYLAWYVLPWTVDVAQIAVLALFVQVLVPHKFVGWLVMLLVIVSQVVLARLGYEHNLYQYGLGPDVPLSDMNGQGHFAADRAWFRVYWSAAAVILVVLTNALWRGATPTWHARARRLGGRERRDPTPGLLSGVGREPSRGRKRPRSASRPPEAAARRSTSPQLRNGIRSVTCSGKPVRQLC